MASKTHKELEFAVEDYTGYEKIFPDFDSAAAFAVVKCLSRGGPVSVDVLVWGPGGARVWGGDDAVAQYNDDPEASVFERIQINADSLGTVA